MTISLRQLEYVAAVAEHRNFRKAAQACFVTQPGLSSQVQQLEAQLDTQVFERSRRTIVLTAAGEVVVSRARRILLEVQELEDEVQALGNPLSGPLRLGVIPTIAPYFLPAVLPRIRRRFPQLKLRLREEKTSDLLEALLAGKLDLLLIALDVPLPDVETQEIGHDPFVAVAQSGHRWDKRKRVSEADLLDEQVLLLDEGHCLRDQAWSICEKEGATELGDFRATSLSTLTQMVAGGLGVTLLPEMAVRVEVGRRKDLVVREFRKPCPDRVIGLAWRPGSSAGNAYRELGDVMGGYWRAHR